MINIRKGEHNFKEREGRDTKLMFTAEQVGKTLYLSSGNRIIFHVDEPIIREKLKTLKNGLD
ncbi:unnamed protein product [Wuchereria bancrofti]|uniref:Uncharacterized protein n=1 Tax=Wuchereria bancrofti TaxID=6293 RepID=A0A3P7DCF9_WUCBA|nr:unnamed protein product [Wuchereria bancrofti]